MIKTVILLLLAYTPFLHAEAKVSLVEAKAIFQKADKELNAVYKKVNSSIEQHRQDKLKEDQRAWIQYRDYVAEFQASSQDGIDDDFKKSVSYWQMMADLTEERVDFVSAWKGIVQEDDWTGTYEDGTGGYLVLKKEGGTLRFDLTVVRGPTHHIGELSGEAKINSLTARFAEKVDQDGKEGAWFTFKQDGQFFIQLDTDNAQMHHGARAYFDGRYLRVSTETSFEK